MPATTDALLQPSHKPDHSMRRHWLSIPLFVALFALGRLPAHGAGIFDQLPAEATGFVAVHNLSAASEKIERVTAIFKELTPGPLPAPLALAKGVTGIGPGLKLENGQVAVDYLFTNFLKHEADGGPYFEVAGHGALMGEQHPFLVLKKCVELKLRPELWKPLADTGPNRKPSLCSHGTRMSTQAFCAAVRLAEKIGPMPSPISASSAASQPGAGACGPASATPASASSATAASGRPSCGGRR